jgi:hypothetical protein
MEDQVHAKALRPVTRTYENIVMLFRRRYPAGGECRTRTFNLTRCVARPFLQTSAYGGD